MPLNGGGLPEQAFDYDLLPMDADFSVELGPEDEILAFPWTDPDGRLRYYDLKSKPELLAEIEESLQFPELGQFLASVNTATSRLETAKCDAWFTNELGLEDEGFGAAGKFGSYVDLLFSDHECRESFPAHEGFARKITQLLRRAPEIPARTEWTVRRCYYEDEGGSEGFYLTFYLFGYGDDAEQSRKQWAIGLKLVEHAIRQLGST
jgi:hypothetical protein